MSSWRYFGSKRKEEFESDLTPKELLDRLYDYQEVFGEEFGIKELLMLEDIRSKALIAEAINDVPEFLFDQLGLSCKMIAVSVQLQAHFQTLQMQCSRSQIISESMQREEETSV